MVLAIDASTPAKATGTTASITTASFTPPDQSLILVMFGTGDAGTTDQSISSITNTGTAITWTRRVRQNRNAASFAGVGQEGGAEIWSGTGNGGAITVTVNGVGSGAGQEKLVKCVVLTGANLTPTNVVGTHNTSGLPSGTVTGCSAASHVFAVSSDWSAGGLGTADSGQTIVDEFHTAGQTTLHSWRTTNTLSAAGSQTMNLTAPAAQDYNLVAIEVVDPTPPVQDEGSKNASAMRSMGRGFY